MSYEQLKSTIKKYHSSDKGKLARQLANKKYYQKLISSKKGRAKKKMYNKRYLNKTKQYINIVNKDILGGASQTPTSAISYIFDSQI